MRPKKKKVTWLSSEGRKLLLKDVKDGTILEDMLWEDVWQIHHRPEFEVGDTPEEARRLFENRLKSICNRDALKKSRAQE